MLVIYEEESREVLDVIEDAWDVKKTATGIEWKTGKIEDMKKPYLVLAESTAIEVGDILTDEQIATAKTPDVALSGDRLVAENKALSDRVDFLEGVIEELIVSIY